MFMKSIVFIVVAFISLPAVAKEGDIFYKSCNTEKQFCSSSVIKYEQLVDPDVYEIVVVWQNTKDTKISKWIYKVDCRKGTIFEPDIPADKPTKINLLDSKRRTHGDPNDMKLA